MTKQINKSVETLNLQPGVLHCLIYRSGGTENFVWHRTLAMPYAEAIRKSRETARMGYPCHVELYASSIAIGLPTTYAPSFPGVKVWS